METNPLIYALLLIPLIIIISVAVFQMLSTNAVSVYENAVSGEELEASGACSGDYTFAYAAQEGSAVVYFGTAEGELTTNYTIEYNEGLTPAVVTIVSDGTEDGCSADYTSYQGTGFTVHKQISTGAWSGFKLSAMLPFIYIAMAIVGIVTTILVSRK